MWRGRSRGRFARSSIDAEEVFRRGSGILVRLVLLVQLVKAVSETFEQRALTEERGLRRLFPGLDFDRVRFMLEAEEQCPSIFEIGGCFGSFMAGML